VEVMAVPPDRNSTLNTCRAEEETPPTVTMNDGLPSLATSDPRTQPMTGPHADRGEDDPYHGQRWVQYRHDSGTDTVVESARVISPEAKTKKRPIEMMVTCAPVGTGGEVAVGEEVAVRPNAEG